MFEGNFGSKEEFLKALKNIDPSTLSGEALNELSMFLENEAVEKARESFYHYVMLMGPIRLDGFKSGRHIEVIANALNDLGYKIWDNTGVTARQQVSLPPGGMKSELCSRLWPSWLLGRWPHVRILLLGHGTDFAKDEFGAKIRDIVRSEEYQRIFPKTKLREDKQTAGRFLTDAGGEVFCSSLEAKIAGRRGHVVITDDVIVEQDAMSTPVRTKLTRDYLTNARSRLLMSPDGAELCAGTRFFQDDLFEFLEKSDAKSESPWKIIKIPALLDEETSKMLRRPGDPEGYLAPGTSFWPEFHPTRRLEMIRDGFAANMWRWNAVYMQNPTSETGAMFSAADFKEWVDDEPPPCHTIIVTADTAYTKKSYSDFTAYQVWGIFNMGEGHLSNQTILLDAGKGKWDFHELCEIFTNINIRFRPDYFIIERRSSGLVLIPELQKRGLPIYDWITEKDKMARAQAAAPLIKSGIFWVPMPKDNASVCQRTVEWLGEITSFPNATHDDAVDALTSYVLFARDNNVLFSNGTDAETWEDEDEFDNEYRSYTSSLLR